MELASLLAEERRARLAAERLLEQKQAELFAANRKLDLHARALSHEITHTRAEVENFRSENQRVKSDLTAAHEKVAIAERRLWMSIQTIRDGFAFFDAESRLIGANAAYLSAFDGLDEIAVGVSYDRILQLMMDEGIVNTEGQGAAEWRGMMMARWLSPRPDPIVLRLWNDRHVRVIDQRGNGGDVLSLVLDITPSVRYEEKLRKARSRAEAANRAKSAFLANMSHEIRTPMNGIVGMADILAETDLTDEQRLYVDTIRSSGEALLVIINDVLDYSKIEAGKMALVSQTFDLERTIHEILLLLQAKAATKGLKLLMDYDIFLPSRFVGDEGRIRQVLVNLAGNAVKFTSHGHVLIRVTGRQLPDGTFDLRIVVEDTGIGIAQDKQAHVFGEFNQVEDTQNRQYEGTGLGLAISRRLVELMGGEIWIDSAPDMGSSFGLRLCLPTCEKRVPPAPRLPAGLQRIAIVDRHKATRDLHGRQLSALGCGVIEADTAAGALALGRSVDLFLIEQELPDMDGVELAGRLRAAGHSGPILLCSEHPSAAARLAGSSLVQGCLQKPVSRLDLLYRLAELDFEPDEGTGPRLFDVLVAEDNKVNQMIFQKMIGAGPFRLRFAENGIEAVEAVRRKMPDIVFMDISMPRMDGKAATAALREIPGAGHLPVIAVTAHAMAGDEDALLAAGLTDYLTKPLRKAALDAILVKYGLRAASG